MVSRPAEPDFATRPRAAFPPGAMFEAGSLAKAMTATLLARMVMAGEVEMESTVGQLLGAEAGAVADIELRELATHTAGLPRLPPNAITMPFWPRDPYRFYDRRKLEKGLARVILKGRGNVPYSNLGFVVLACGLNAAAGQPFNDLLTEQVFVPAGMVAARCQPCPRRGLVRGYGPILLGGRRWHEPLPGAGGVDCSIQDLARWLQINLCPEMTELEPAIRLCQQPHVQTEAGNVGLARQISKGMTRHNGATGSFQAFVGFFPEKAGVAALSNVAPSTDSSHDRAAGAWLRAWLEADERE